MKLKKKTKQDRASLQRQQLVHHVKEIRSRLLVVVAVIVLGMGIGYSFYEHIFNLIRSPLHTTLHYTSPAGSFNFVIEICFVVALLFALPVIVYNIIMFLQPALDKRLTRLRVYSTTFFSLLLATSGAAFAFYIILPLALKFFFKFEVDGLVALISAIDYLNFVINIVVTFAIIFQLPLIINTIDHIKPLSIKTLLRGEKYVIVGSIGVAVVVPFALDPVVQVLIASPIIILYNLSIVGVFVQHSVKKRKNKRLAKRALQTSHYAQSSYTATTQRSINRPTPLPNYASNAKATQAPVGNRRAPRARSMDGVSTPYRKNIQLRPTTFKGTTTSPKNAGTLLPASVRSSGRLRPTRSMSDIRPATTFLVGS